MLIEIDSISLIGPKKRKRRSGWCLKWPIKVEDFGFPTYFPQVAATISSDFPRLAGGA
jgi:hypothetical protein